MHLGVQEQTIAVTDSLNLSWLDTETGQLTGQQRLDTLGLDTPLMDLQLLPNQVLLAAETNTKRIRRCARGENRCTTLADLSWLVGRFFKFHFDPDTERLFVAGTHSNQLWELKPPYDARQVRVYCSQLSSPNEIWFSNEGRLWVTDTDHHRVIELEDAEPVAIETGFELPGETHLTSKTFPLDFAGSGQGNWWVLLAGATYLDADLIEYAPDGTPLRRIMLPDGSVPIAVEALSDGVLVADLKGFALYRSKPMVLLPPSAMTPSTGPSLPSKPNGTTTPCSGISPWST